MGRRQACIAFTAWRVIDRFGKDHHRVARLGTGFESVSCRQDGIEGREDAFHLFEKRRTLGRLPEALELSARERHLLVAHGIRAYLEVGREEISLSFAK